MQVIYDILRCWVKKNPVKIMDAGSYHAKILAKPPVIEANFSNAPGTLSKARTEGKARFVQNPDNWGPRPRHGRPMLAHEIEAETAAAAAATAAGGKAEVAADSSTTVASGEATLAPEPSTAGVVTHSEQARDTAPCAVGVDEPSSSGMPLDGGVASGNCGDASGASEADKGGDVEPGSEGKRPQEDNGDDRGDAKRQKATSEAGAVGE